MRAKKKLSKRMLTILLSAIMIVEPVSGSITVRAAEPDAGKVMLEEVTEETVGTDDKKETPENPDSTEEEKKGDTSGDQESGDTGSDDQNKEEGADDRDNQGEDNSDQKETDEKYPDEEDSEEGSAGEDQKTEKDQDVSISGNDIDEDEAEEEDEDDLGKFSSMPSGYQLTAEQKQMKRALSASMDQFDASQEGETYIERQVFAFAETNKEAEAIAEAYHAELIEYDEDVAVLKLTEGTSVAEALNVAADLDNNLPAVYPDYYRYAHEEEIPQDNSSLIVVEEEYELEGASSEEVLFEESLFEEPTLETYELAVEALGDPYMSYDSDNYQWQHVNVGSVYAWDAGYKGAGIKVAVLDTGVSSVILSAGAYVESELSVEKDIIATKTDDPNDRNGHGTHVAGIIAAELNHMGGAGIAPEASIVNVKVLGDDGSGSDHDIIQGITAAKEYGVDIMNLSLGGIGYNPGVEKVVNEAYNAGIAIFVSAGNDGGNNMCYPAALNNVICVAATDTNNQRAYFSNYGSWVDLSAPGVDIWSTAPSGDKRASKSGTSQACPVAAGEAAVILSANLKSIPEKKDKKRVDALKKVMQQNTVSAGSGMGKGITSLTKVFKLSAAAAKPNAPTISARDISTDIERTLEITIKAQTGMAIYYTTNGKNPVFKNGEAGAGTEYLGISTPGFPAPIHVNDAKAAKGTVKAIAVNAAGVASAVKSYSYTLKSYVREIKVSGPTRVERGKSITLSAAVIPTYADNKAVKWELQDMNGSAVDPSEIKIDAKGKITTSKNLQAGAKYKVIVTAKDNSDAAKAATQEHTVEIVEPNTAITKIAFNKKVTKVLWLTEENLEENPADTVLLSDYVVAEMKDDTGKKNVPVAIESLSGHLTWSSSKPKVAEVDSKTGEVTAKAAGTTTITVKTDDNLAKKATVNITVKQAVTYISIMSNDPQIVAAGKSIALKADIWPAKPANKKVNWSIAPGYGNSASPKDMKNVTINKTSGKITTKAAAVPGDYIVTAEAADGKGAKDTRTVRVVKGAIGGITLDTKKMTLDSQSGQKTITANLMGVKGKGGAIGDIDPSAFEVTASNWDVVDIHVYPVSLPTSNYGQIMITLTPTGRVGKTNIVVAATDGSNKKATCAVTVGNGINKIELLDKQDGTKKVSKLTLFRSGTVTNGSDIATLYVKASDSIGEYRSAYEVKSNNPLVKVSVDKYTGEVRLDASSTGTGKATITATATDGSKKKATCTVTVVNPASRINIAVKGSNSRYIAKGKTLQLQATMESEYGAISNKKVKWSIQNINVNGVSINSSGKITASKDATGSGVNSNNKPLNQVMITAEAADGSGVKGTYYIYIADPVRQLKLWYIDKKGKSWYLNTKYITVVPKAKEVGQVHEFYVDWLPDVDLKGGVVVSSSNPKVMSATARVVNLGGYNVLAVDLSADKAGDATITVKAQDGGGAQVKYMFRVK